MRWAHRNHSRPQKKATNEKILHGHIAELWMSMKLFQYRITNCIHRQNRENAHTHIRPIILKLPMFHYLWTEVVHQNAELAIRTYSTIVIISKNIIITIIIVSSSSSNSSISNSGSSTRASKTWCNSTMLNVVITLVKNVPPQHHCSYLKFYCSHMSIFLQQTIARSDVSMAGFSFSVFFFFFIVYAFILWANAESYEKYSRYKQKCNACE